MLIYKNSSEIILTLMVIFSNMEERKYVKRYSDYFVIIKNK